MDVYREYVGIRAVNIRVEDSRRLNGNWAYAHYTPRRYLGISIKVLHASKRTQLVLLIHELNHFKTPKAGHGGRWKDNTYLWGSAFQMRYVRTDAEVKAHIQGGCSGLDTYCQCDTCKSKEGVFAW